MHNDNWPRKQLPLKVIQKIF